MKKTLEKRLDEERLKDVWRRYKTGPCEELRNLLIEHYLPLVRYIAERVAVKLPKSVELDDLMSAGIFGLMDAIDGFDLSHGVKFETYCTTRVRGAILDELRAMDWVPRMVRAKAHKLEQATRELEATLGRFPTGDEVAARMGLSRQEYDEIVRDSSAAAMFSLSKPVEGNEEHKEMKRIDIVEDHRFPDPIRRIEKTELRERVIASLDETERMVVVLYYYEEMTMKEIGSILDLSESRVCQIHAHILNRLRYQFRHARAEV